MATHSQVNEVNKSIEKKNILCRELVPSNFFIWARPGELVDGQWVAVTVLNLRVKLGEVSSSHFIADRTVSNVIRCNTVAKQDYFQASEVKGTIRDENTETEYSEASDVTSSALCSLVLLTKGVYN